MPIGLSGDFVTVWAELYPRHFKCGRQEVVRQRSVQQLALVVEGQFFVEGIADALRDATWICPPGSSG